MIFVFAIFSILLLNLVSAYSPYGWGFSYLGRGGDIVDNLVNAGAPVLELLFGGYTESVGDMSSGEMLFLKFLLFILMFVVIQAVLKKVDLFKNNLAVVGIISIAIPLISIRFMSANQLIYMVLPSYGALGIALTTILPFFVFFFFIHNTGMGSVGRKVSWAFFIIIFLVLWSNRTEEIGDIGNQIYFWTMIGMILIVWQDKRIHSYLEIGKFKKAFKTTDNAAAAALLTEYHNIKISGVKSPYTDARLKELEKQAKDLGIRLSE